MNISGDDEQLLAALTRGDHVAAAQLLVQEHAPTIGRTCMALLGSQGEAEAALQETLLAALVGSLPGDGSLRARLLGVARQCCVARLEARSRERTAEACAADEPLSAAQRARRRLAEIRPSEREALVLRFTAGLGFRELGQALGIDATAAQKRAARGLSRLRNLEVEKEP